MEKDPENEENGEASSSLIEVDPDMNLHWMPKVHYFMDSGSQCVMS